VFVCVCYAVGIGRSGRVRSDGAAERIQYQEQAAGRQSRYHKWYACVCMHVCMMLRVLVCVCV
jgi:hypothetical protein